jgi:DNA polymerase-3 subunit delta'
MSFARIIKNQDFFKNLIEKKEKNTLSNAILFSCEDRITAKHVLTLSALLLEYQTFELFDEQSAEFKRIENGIDLDVKVYPKNNEKMLVADSNEVVYEASIKPVNLPYKIFVINNIDISTEEAQNKLLKVLEEPQKNVYFLLSAQTLENVLPTIKSRCDKIKINALEEETINTICKNQLASILGEGYLGKTLAFNDKENLKDVCDFAVSLFTELKNSKDVLKYSKRLIENRDDLDVVLTIMSLCIEDIIKIKCEREDLCKLKPYIADLKGVEMEFSVEALCEIAKLIANLMKKFDFNANINVALDNFLLKMLEVKYLCK